MNMLTKQRPLKKIDPSLWLPYAQMQTAPLPLEVVRTQGVTLTIRDPRKGERTIIDSVASWWTACHGYSHPYIVEAIQRQANTFSHVMMGGLVHAQATRLAHRLAALLPQDLDHVFFSESGSVAMEIAMKMAWQYWMHQQVPERSQFLYFHHAYHGDTFLTMSVCDPCEGYHKSFHGLLPAQCFQKIPETPEEWSALEQWLSTNSHTIAAMVIEPLVQGCGGMKMHSSSALQQLCTLCRSHGILIIFDEIFTGFGRTGTLFACEQIDLVPDIVCLSKALTGGSLPLAVSVARRHIYEAFLSDDPDKALMHGTTFMGNALGCAAANASLDLFESEPRLLQVAQIQAQLIEELSPIKSLPGVKDVRVLGAIGVVQFTEYLGKKAVVLQEKLLQAGVWARPFKDILYTTPALTIESSALSHITGRFLQGIAAL